MSSPRSAPRWSPRRRLSFLCALVLAMSMSLLAPQSAMATHGGLHVTDLADASFDAADLAQSLVGAGVTVDDTSVTFTGDDRAGGTFTGGTGIIGFDEGIILSSGLATDVVGPNDLAYTGTSLNTPGDADLDALADTATYDAAFLEFEFEAGEGAEEVSFQYVFGSDEYNEFVGSNFNDVFAFWVNDTNCALVGDPAVPVSINTINNGYLDVEPTNPHLYINNDPFEPDGTGTTVPEGELRDTEMDGLTVVLTCVAAVTTGTNTMRMGIADAGDSSYDSWVLIQAASLTTGPEPGAITGTVTDADTSAPIAGATVSADGSSTTTAADGSYTLSGLEAGDYTVSASATGYVTDSAAATVAAGETTTVDFALAPEVVEPPVGNCVDLLAGQHTVAGQVCVANDGDTLTVTYTTVDGWMLTGTHLHVADDAARVPQTKKGNPKVGHFAHDGSHGSVSEVSYTISLDSLDADAGDVLTIAAHAAVERMEGDTLVQESAWGDGDRFVDQGNWATYVTYTVT